MRLKLTTLILVSIVICSPACGKSDAELQKAAVESLTADRLTGITVSVKDGVATLTGEVGDAAIKSKAELSVRSVEGINLVTNDLVIISRPTAAEDADDAKLAANITRELRNGGCAGASVTVSNGKVTVTGEVSADAYARCLLIIQQAGVASLDNQLKKGG